jgi:Yip1 domain
MNLVARVKNILLTPQTEWGVIERESGDTSYLFKNYVAILAAIPAVCSVIGMTMLSAGPKHLMIASAIVYAIIGYLLSFVGVWLFAVVIDMLAPSFGGRKNFSNAMKLSAYAHTPYWLAGIFYLIPALSVLTILGLYAVYLLWVGLPVLMKAPQEKTIVYTIAVVVCAIVFFIVVGLIAAAVAYAILGPMMFK